MSQLDAKQHFHFAKLSLFTMRLLSRAQDERGRIPDMERLVASVAKDNALDADVPLLHQASILSHAFIIVVWLRERLLADGLNPDQLDIGVDSARVLEHQPGARKNGDEVRRDLSRPAQVIRTIRNAIAHGRVAFGDDDVWEFTDADPRSGERVRLSLDWPELGKLCDTFMFEYQKLVYPH